MQKKHLFALCALLPLAWGCAKNAPTKTPPGHGVGDGGVGAGDDFGPPVPNYPDGSSTDDAQVVAGDPQTCAEATASKSYIGCDYWPTVLMNPVWSIFD